MTGLTLYHTETSPYVRKVMMLVHEAGLAGQVALIRNASGTPLRDAPALIAANPLGKVPVLARADGAALYDSRVICQYLDARAGTGFYPDGARRWDTLTLEAMADGMLDAAVQMVYEGRLRPEEMQFAPYVEGQWRKIARSLDTLEGRWIAYLAGPLCMGQMALGCALGYLDLRQAERDWRSAHPQLAAWQARIAQRESWAATAPPAS
ncbi:MAG: glutathione S-transferase [Roseinatronobacter sp.]